MPDVLHRPGLVIKPNTTSTFGDREGHESKENSEIHDVYPTEEHTVHLHQVLAGIEVIRPVERMNLDILCVLIPRNRVSRLRSNTTGEEMVDVVKEHAVSEGLEDTGFRSTVFRLLLEVWDIWQKTRGRGRKIFPLSSSRYD